MGAYSLFKCPNLQCSNRSVDVHEKHIKIVSSFNGEDTILVVVHERCWNVWLDSISDYFGLVESIKSIVNPVRRNL